MRTASVILAVPMMSVAAHGLTRKVDFEQDAVGQPPKGFVFGLTGKIGAPGRWIVQRKQAVYFDGSKLYDVEDPTFTRAGRVGLWTKADSVTHFDDLTVNSK